MTSSYLTANDLDLDLRICAFVTMLIKRRVSQSDSQSDEI